MICNRNIKGRLVWEADGNIGRDKVTDEDLRTVLAGMDQERRRKIIGECILDTRCSAYRRTSEATYYCGLNSGHQGCHVDLLGALTWVDSGPHHPHTSQASIQELSAELVTLRTERDDARDLSLSVADRIAAYERFVRAWDAWMDSNEYPTDGPLLAATCKAREEAWKLDAEDSKSEILNAMHAVGRAAKREISEIDRELAARAEKTPAQKLDEALHSNGGGMAPAPYTEVPISASGAKLLLPGPRLIEALGLVDNAPNKITWDDIIGAIKELKLDSASADSVIRYISRGAADDLFKGQFSPTMLLEPSGNFQVPIRITRLDEAPTVLITERSRPEPVPMPCDDCPGKGRDDCRVVCETLAESTRNQSCGCEHDGAPCVLAKDHAGDHISRDGAVRWHKAETLESQIFRLGQFICERVPGESSKDEGAVDTAIRCMQSQMEALGQIRFILSAKDGESTTDALYRALTGK